MMKGNAAPGLGFTAEVAEAHGGVRRFFLCRFTQMVAGGGGRQELLCAGAGGPPPVS